MNPPGADAEPVADVIVIGAGIAGLCAATELQRAGFSVVVVDKARGVGGRMATRRVADAICDHGAQFFTVRGRAFGGIVAAAHAAGDAVVWCDGFSRADTVAGAVEPAADGHPRWRGARGMTDLPKRLAAGLGADAVRTATKAVAIGRQSGGVAVEVELPGGDRAVLGAAAAVVTAPVPQAIDLFHAGGLDAVADRAALETLATVSYDPCFALLAVLRAASLVPPPGAIQFASGPVRWIADNQAKGITSRPALTIHASGEWSRERFDDAADDVADALLASAGAWIDGDPRDGVVEWSLQRWKFATPTTILPTPLVAVSSDPPVVCCGDAFAGPRVEGAASSGMAAARWLARVMPKG